VRLVDLRGGRVGSGIFGAPGFFHDSTAAVNWAFSRVIDCWE